MKQSALSVPLYSFLGSGGLPAALTVKMVSPGGSTRPTRNGLPRCEGGLGRRPGSPADSLAIESIDTTPYSPDCVPSPDSSPDPGVYS
eukprot:6198396-Prymnesium_polylepis.1